jgi:putative Mg2+ transporter-C (MgtC) family protein
MLTTEEILFRFFISIVLGAIVGFERERIGKEAGVRTLMLVCGGAAIFTMISIILPFIGSGGEASRFAINTDFSRVASNIVVGIGFLGAGIIIHTENGIRGLTTAALVWFVAAIGTLVGSGLILVGAVFSVCMTALLYLLHGVTIGKQFLAIDSKDQCKKDDKEF